MITTVTSSCHTKIEKKLNFFLSFDIIILSQKQQHNPCYLQTYLLSAPVTARGQRRVVDFISKQGKWAELRSATEVF